MQQSHIEREKKTIALMIRLYCRKKEKNSELCSLCRELIEYAHQRLDHCPFGEAKTSCKNCAIHCYVPIEQKRIRQVMRYGQAGDRA
ncbi:nitrous oxide-stimulated promoter family protein [Bacteroidales bacterium OttesenSCG-928-B11]|nr:nitrous oxide-stimulated promoter family protein [Bacteroidales bacterium OttesenSCG-928-E04]MDL2308151.1 nitrous oxide-stimulated promoter family protein [Bacteroidales bacterium OttesenSCG-928-C03]MDL2311494.1 nitrous oxide-stimulated promoter family protein [Bacteroidales bacterium OttesenSCG-928-B11]MDL2325577.1 nitrous oxide-stimulated promoter family protein [Bacteroidales bacterium OttesenSCG-928-A14]